MKIEIDGGLGARAEGHAKKAGYSSLGEFVEHLIERELSAAGASGGGATDDDVKKRLQGLGYID